ncbi:Tex-like N-terminal domain-containing protein [Sulfurovum sp.]|uniref:Tex-like N-terminal domain-containing protein n=1 Tax=Sulfurovum sp. TaxID=1969726 RepID=UPI0025EEE1C1|nr:Tex-like N-terminal domain-containing protein [Sulfurovum sp.]
MHSLINLLTQRTSLSKQAVTNILKLLEEGATIPFIARYRKEMTGGASDEALREFHEIYMASKRLIERKEEILHILAEKELLTPALKDQIDQDATVTPLEDIYRPFKEKKNTQRASSAIRNGLEYSTNNYQREEIR